MQTKDDLRKLFQDRLARLFTEQLPSEAVQRYRFMHTSGTTGLPLPVLYTDRPDWEPAFLGTGNRVVMIFGSKPLRVDFARSYVDDDTAPSDIMCLNPKTAPEVLERVRTDFKPNAFVCPPSVLLRSTQTWPQESLDAITSITLTGELATKTITEEITTRFPNAVVRNYYPSTEAGLIGEQCEFCEWNEFHPALGVDIEIFQPDQNGVGYLLVSKENKGGLALDRYRTGDLARMSAHENGRQTFHLYGREGFDYIKLAGALLVREEFDRVARELERYVDDYKAEVRTNMLEGIPSHQLTIYVSPARTNTLGADELVSLLAKEFANRLFVTPKATLTHAIENRIFEPLMVHVVSIITHSGTKPQRLRLLE